MIPVIDLKGDIMEVNFEISDSIEYDFLGVTSGENLDRIGPTGKRDSKIRTNTIDRIQFADVIYGFEYTQTFAKTRSDKSAFIISFDFENELFNITH